MNDSDNATTMETISITALSPAESPPTGKAIKAVVSLFWPYSSSTKQCALLLADPDFRLRNKKGQVRVRFTGPSAGAVAKAKIGIGDEVLLELRGASWAGDAGVVLTPGRSVDGELVYKGTLGLKVVKKASGEEVNTTVAINESTPPPEASEEDALRGRQNGSLIHTPARPSPSYMRSSLNGVDVVPIYSSPAFVKRLKLSGEKSTWDPFADAELEIDEQPIKKQRVSFGNVASWKYAERTPSPEKAAPTAQPGEDVDSIRRSPIANGFADAITSESLNRRETSPSGAVPPQTAMPPPSLPRLQMPDDASPEGQPTSGNEGPSTPKLQPVPSSALPLPSPFPVESTQLQFTRSETTVRPPHLTQQASESFVEAPVSGREAELIERSGHTPLGAARGDPLSLLEDDLPTDIPEIPQQAASSVVQRQQTTELVHDDSGEPVEVVRQDHMVQVHNAPDHDSDQPVQEQDGSAGSDTEEDEEMYLRHIRGRASIVDADRNGEETDDHDDDMSGIDEDDAEEVVEDMGDPPEDDDGDDGESEDDGTDAESDVQVVETISIVDSDDDDDEAARQGDAPEDGVGETEKDRMVRQTRGLQPSLPKETQRGMTTIDSGGDVGKQILDDPKSNNAAEASGAVAEMGAANASHGAAPNQETNSGMIATSSRLPPKTPASLVGPPAGLFGFEGGSSPSIPKSTPRSDKDRVMAKTYSSLFGFKASPSPELQRHVPQDSTPTPAAADEAALSRVAQERLQAANAGPKSPSPKPSDVSDAFAPTTTQENAEEQSSLDNSPTRDIAVHDVEPEPQRVPAQEAAIETHANDEVEITDVADIADGSLLESVRRDEAEQEATAAESGAELDNAPALHAEAEEIQPAADVEMEEAEEAEEASKLPQDDPVPDGLAINEELGAAIVSAPELEQASAPAPSQNIHVIDLGSSDDEGADEEQTQPTHRQPHMINDQSFDPGHPDFSQFQQPAHYNRTETSQGSALQSDMLDTTQTTVDRSEVQTPIAHDEDMTIPETVPDEPVPWTGPGQQSFFAEQTQHQEELAEEPGIPLTQQTNNTIGDYHYFSFQSATSVATDNSENSLPPTAQPSFARDEEEETSEAQPESPKSSDAHDQLSGRATSQPADGGSAQTEMIELISPSPDPTDTEDAEVMNEESQALQQAASELARPQKEGEQSALNDSSVDSFSQFAQRADDVALASSSFQSAQADVPIQHQEMGRDESATHTSADRQELSAPSQRASNRQTSRQSLPPSPDDSQGRLESQQFETQLHRGNALPPTPQLTGGDSLKVMVEFVEDEQPAVGTTSPRLLRSNREVNGEEVQSSRAKDTAVRRSPRKRAQQSQESQPPEAPSTPPHTRSQGPVEDEATLSPETKTTTRRSSKKPQTKHDDSQEPEQKSQRPRTRQTTRTATPEAEVNRALLSPEAQKSVRRSPRKNTTASQNSDVDTEHRVEQLPTDGATSTAGSSKKPARRSFRLGAVPEAISNWFSPKASPQSKTEEKQPEAEAPGEVEKTVMRRHRRSTGFSTDFAYFMPLSNLNEKLNSPEKVDVLAVVADETKAPERAKGGQRDYYTIFHVTDPSLEQDESIRVEVYRPWHANLPVAQVGDVVLLRGFSVKSRKRQTYLFSADTSAWCAWRYADAAEGDSEKPAWARKKRAVSFSGMKEEVKGPPVELGDEERGHAAELRAWWHNANLSGGSSSVPGSAEKRRRSEKL